MQEGITLRAYFHEAGIQSGHELAHLAQIDVANGERCLALLVLVFNQVFVFKQCDGYLFRLDINDYFTCHSCNLVV